MCEMFVTDGSGRAPLRNYPMLTSISLVSHNGWYCVVFVVSFGSLASKGFPSVYSKSVCVCLHSEMSEPTMFSQTTPDEYPPTPPPCRWPALITLLTLANFQLVWRRLCDVLFRSSCHTRTAVCTLPEYHSDRKYNVHSKKL